MNTKYSRNAVWLQEEDNVVDGRYVDSLTTTYRITSAIVNKLKSLFGFLAENVIQKATQTLNLFSKGEFACLTILNEEDSDKSIGKVKSLWKTEIKIQSKL